MMVFWNWGRKAKEGKPQPNNIAAKAWDDASTAMLFYMDYREKYNLPFTPARWRDDFALGFRDGIGQIHFAILNNVPDGDIMFQWRQAVIANDTVLEEAWLRAISDNGDYTERGVSSFQAARILETWRLKKDNVEGGLDYIEQHEREYRMKFPDATQFQVDHQLIMSYLVIPLILADKIIHPYLLVV